MTDDTFEFHLGDCSSYRKVAAPDMREVQKALFEDFKSHLGKVIPNEVCIGQALSLNSAWQFEVHFDENSTVDTQPYRKKVIEKFPYARVTTGNHCDIWTVPYAEGIASGLSPVLTMVIFVFCLVITATLGYLAFM